jgi:anti-sigma-K factor RskA
MKTTSWKTTAAGVSAIVAAVAGALGLMFDANPNTNPDWTAVIAAVTAGIGLIMARDNDKSSEDVSAK